MKSKFTENQIIGILAETGASGVLRDEAQYEATHEEASDYKATAVLGLSHRDQ